MLVWLETSALASAMREAPWLYPGVEILHILGFVLLVGSVGLLDLHLLGAVRGVNFECLARALLPWSWAGLLLVLATGILMFAAHATDLAAHPAFRLKLALLGIAAGNAWLFHFPPSRHSRSTGNLPTQAPGHAHVAATVSLSCWIGVIVCGRLIAYL